MKVLVTGAAGFIGFHVCDRLCRDGNDVIGIDNLNSYYDVSLKQNRLKKLHENGNFLFKKVDLADQVSLLGICSEHKLDRIIHLGAQAGVRYSIDNPGAYVDSNLVGHMNMLEAARQYEVEHMVYASSSSVYGMNRNMPFRVSDAVDHPISLYAATKKSNEILTHSYSHLYGLPTTGLRFFTVYGPWGRPDMAPMLFADAILNDRPIKVFNNGNMQRDFTYVGDIVESIVRVLNIIPSRQKNEADSAFSPAESSAPFKIHNIGNGSPVKLMDFISALENALGKSAIKDFQPMQPGDVEATWADTSSLEEATKYRPKTDIQEGVSKFASWYMSYYGY